jgi:hypothetical protein
VRDYARTSLYENPEPPLRAAPTPEFLSAASRLQLLQAKSCFMIRSVSFSKTKVFPFEAIKPKFQRRCADVRSPAKKLKGKNGATHRARTGRYGITKCPKYV